MARKTPEGLVRKAELQGWRVKPIKKGWFLLAPDGVHTATIHRTPSDHRWYENAIRELRKGGFSE